MAKTPITKRPGTPAYKRRQARIRARAERARANDLIGPRTGSQVRKEAAAAGELQFGPAIREQQAQIRGAETFAAQRLPTLYEQYRQDVAQAAQRAQDAYATAQAQMAQSQQGIQQQYGEEQQRRAAEAQKVSQVTGGALSAPPEASQASLALSKGQAAFGGLLGARRAEEASFYGQLGAAGTKRHIESQQAEQMRQRELRAKLADLTSQRGAAGVEFVRKARGEERQAAAEAKAFGLDVAQERAKQQQAGFQRRAKRRDQALARQKAQQQKMKDDRKYQLDLEKFGAAQAKERYQKAHKLGPYKPGASRGGGPGGRTPSQIRSDRANYNKAMGDTKSYAAAHPEFKQHTLAGKKRRIIAIRGLKSDYGYSDKKAATIVKKVAGF